MSGSLLFLYLALCLGSTFMVFSWGPVAWAFRHDRPLFRSRRWNVATALTVHALCMAVATGLRAWDVVHGADVSGSDAGFLLILLVGLFASKAQLVWAGALGDDDRRVLWTWPLFLACVTFAAIFVFVGGWW